MTFDVLVYKIITNYSGSWNSDMGSHTLSADNYIHVLLDDTTETFVVKYQASPLEGINILGTLTEGPNLFFGFDGAVELQTALPYYQWCNGTTLTKVNVLANFPYSFLSYFPGALECVIAPTCDLEISSLYTITPATGPGDADGALAVSATSSNGVIKYALFDFNYATEGQLSGTFNALLPNTYTIYAKDEIGCTDTITIEVPVTTVYGVRHRLDFTDLHAISHKAVRYDIEERGYGGAIEEMCGGMSPVIVRYEGDRDDGSVAIVPSHVVLQVMVEIEGQYTHLHQQDDRKYRGKLYIGDDFGSLELYHVGYAVPEFHAEPYLHTPYPLEVTFSDQLGEMKNIEFKDVNDNKFKGDLKAIKILSEVLKLTGLELPIRCGINVFEENMETDAEDDPLDQVYVDSRIYYDKGTMNCSDVLKSIIEPFRGQLFQSQGYWWIIRLSDAVGTFPYREFDFNGDYDSNDTFDPVVMLGTPTEVRAGAGLMFINRTQRLEYLRNYGQFSITHDLRKDGNLIDEGRFEAEDIIDIGSGNKMFKNWNATIGQPGTTFGHETVINGNSLGAFYFDFSMANNAQADSKLYSVVIPMDAFGKYRFSFQYLVEAKYNVPFIRIAWSLKFHTVSDTYIWLCTAPNGVWQYEVTEQLNELYVTEYDKWQTFEVFQPLSNIIITDSVEISFYAHNHYGRDFADETALRAFDLGAMENPLGVRRYMAGEIGETNVYTSAYSDEADSFPDVVRPDNFTPGSSGRDWLWRLDKIINLGPNVSLVNRTKFDNVALAFYPLVFSPTTQYIEPQETLTYSDVVDELIESAFSKDVLLGDMIRYNNEFERNERNIYRAYFRYADGTPTQFWARAGVDEQKNLLDILLDDYIGQFSQPQRKLTGQKAANTVLHFVNCLRDTIDSKRYRPLTFEFDVLNAFYSPEACCVGTGGDGEPPLILADFNCDFNNDFDIDPEDEECGGVVVDEAFDYTLDFTL